MARVLEIEGKTIDEAIFVGLEQMGLSFEEVDIDILQQNSNGFLGIGKACARVRLTQRDMADIWDDSVKLSKPVSNPIPTAVKAQPVKDDRPPRKPQSDQRERRPQPQRRRTEETPIEKKDIMGEPVSADEPAIAFLAGVLSSMGIDGQIKAVRNEEGLHIDIAGDRMGQIIGYRGETLDSLQYLVSLVENKGKDDYVRVTLDTENYRAKREQTLVRLANRLADKALKDGRRVALEPMNPYERRIIHYSLQNYAGVSTVSEGVEPNRRVIIVPETK